MGASGTALLLVAMAGGNTLPILLLAALQSEGVLDQTDPTTLVLHVTMAPVAMFLFGALLVESQSRIGALFSLPISTPAIVAWRLLPAMIAIFLETAASALAINALFHLDWPIWGPALFSAAAFSLFLAVVWACEDSGWILPIGVLTAAGLGAYFKCRYGDLRSLPSRWWTQVTMAELAFLVAISLLGFLIAIWGVSRRRRGDLLPSFDVASWWQRGFSSGSRSTTPFQSAAEAQSWSEWRAKGWVMPVVCAIAMIAALSIWCMVSRDLADLARCFLGGAGLLCVLGMFGTVIGVTGPNERDLAIGSFLATRPLSDALLAKILIRTTMKSVLASWGIWFVGVVTVAIVARREGVAMEMGRLGWWFWPGALLVTWTIAGIGASLAMTGRKTLLLGVFLGVYGALLGLAFLSKVLLPQETQMRIGHLAVAVIGVFFIAITSLAFRLAHRLALVSTPMILSAGAVWAMLSAIAMGTLWRMPQAPVPLSFFFVGLLALSIAPFAAAPLAMTWNRHR